MTLDRTIRLGIIGCGVIGQKHIESAATSPHVTVTAVADINEEAVKQVAEKYGIESYYTSAEQLLEHGDVDAVVLALLTSVRTGIAIMAIEKGKHVLLEKPAGMNRHEVERMLKLQKGQTLAVCSSRFRYYPSAKATRDFISNGGLGEIRVIRCKNLHTPRAPQGKPVPWLYRKQINGGGVMADWGVYDIDYVLGTTGWQITPEWIMGQTWGITPELAEYIDPDSDAETHTAAYIKCENNIAILFERGAHIPGPQENVWEMTGTKGTLKLDMLPGDEKIIRFYAASAEHGYEETVVWNGTESWSTVHSGPILDFGEAIVNGTKPMTSLEQALVIQKITDAIYESASEGKPVQMN
jgi:UDP-N-acetyl-2-amino-2-deoxyglucuronate dehydrogenase